MNMDKRYIVRFESADGKQTCVMMVEKPSIGAAGIWACGKTVTPWYGEKRALSGWEVVSITLVKEGC